MYIRHSHSKHEPTELCAALACPTLLRPFLAHALGSGVARSAREPSDFSVWPVKGRAAVDGREELL